MTTDGRTATAVQDEVVHFYSRQMRLLDEGLVDEYAQTFTADAVFTADARPAPQQGREQILAGAKAAADALAEAGVQNRHWLGMVEAVEQQDGTVHAAHYAIVFRTQLGGRPEVQLTASARDVLVRCPEGFQVRLRQVHRDDIARA